MVEPISMSIGVVALASLFSTCIECFDYFELARTFSTDYELQLVKLDVEKTRLLAWGDAVSIYQKAGEGRASELDHELVFRACLERINLLLNDANGLKNKYGLTEKEASAEHTPTQKNPVSRYSRFRSQISHERRSPGILRRTVWAIHDKPKFESLIRDLRELIDGLNAILPPEKVSRQREKIGFDIKSIPDISCLRLVEEACSGIHQSWSDAASVIIEASERATAHGGNVEQWIEDKEGLQDSGLQETEEPGPSTQRTAVTLHHFGKVYMIFTDPCLEKDSSTPCDGSEGNFGIRCHEWANVNHLASFNHPFNLGKRISDSIFADVIFQRSDPIFDELELKGKLIQKPRIVATVGIYCAPCISLYQTARDICRGFGKSPHINFDIRVDDRLKSSCCSSSISRAEQLRLLLQESENKERKRELADRLDRHWIEQRIFRAEEGEDNKTLGTASVQKDMTDVLNEYIAPPKRDGWIVLLGEVDSCTSMMDHFNCLPQARMPRVNEIWRLSDCQSNEGKCRWKREFFGRYTPSERALIRRNRVGGAVNAPSPVFGSQSLQPPRYAHTGHQITPPASPSPKRLKTSTSSEKSDD